MYVPDTITTFMSCVCVWRGAANPAGSLNNAPNAPFAWSPQRSATLTPGAPWGSRSVHFKSAAGMTTSRLAAAFGALFALASPDPCAKTARANTNDTPNTRMFLGLIELLLVMGNLAPELSPSNARREGMNEPGRSRPRRAALPRSGPRERVQLHRVVGGSLVCLSVVSDWDLGYRIETRTAVERAGRSWKRAGPHRRRAGFMAYGWARWRASVVCWVDLSRATSPSGRLKRQSKRPRAGGVPGRDQRDRVAQPNFIAGIDHRVGADGRCIRQVFHRNIRQMPDGGVVEASCVTDERV